MFLPTIFVTLKRSFSLTILIALALLGVQARALDGACGADEAKISAPPMYPTDPVGRAAYVQKLVELYNIDPNKVVWGEKYPFIVNGSYSPPAQPDYTNVVEDTETYDVAVVGGGVSGLAGTLYHVKNGYKTLLLEASDSLGGIAATGTIGGIKYADGGAYVSPPGKSVWKFYHDIKLGGSEGYKKAFKIRNTVDSYKWNGKWIHGLWTEKTLEEVPKSAKVFKYLLLKAKTEGKLPYPPFESDPNTKLYDSYTWANYIRTMPAQMEAIATAKDASAEAKQIYAEFKADKSINQSEPMDYVLGIQDNYSRSAMGGPAEQTNAAIGMSFYPLELGARYAGMDGTAFIADAAQAAVATDQSLLTSYTGASVVQVITKPDGVDLYYVKGGVTHLAHARATQWSAPMKLAPKTIKDFATIAPVHNQIISNLKGTLYQTVMGHNDDQFETDSYDNWQRNDKAPNANPSANPTDVIDARWQQYRGMRKRLNPDGTPDKHGVMTVYNPLPVGTLISSEQQVMQLAENAMDFTVNEMTTVVQAQGKMLHVMLLEIAGYPFPMQMAEPGYFAISGQLTAPVGGNVWLANNQMGDPSIDDAIVRGELASQNIAKYLGKPLSQTTPVGPNPAPLPIPQTGP